MAETSCTQYTCISLTLSPFVNVRLWVQTCPVLLFISWGRYSTRNFHSLLLVRTGSLSCFSSTSYIYCQQYFWSILLHGQLLICLQSKVKKKQLLGDISFLLLNLANLVRVFCFCFFLLFGTNFLDRKIKIVVLKLFLHIVGF